MSSLPKAPPRENDPQASWAYPGADHEGPVEEDVDAGLGLDHPHLTKASRHTRHQLYRESALCHG